MHRLENQNRDAKAVPWVSATISNRNRVAPRIRDDQRNILIIYRSLRLYLCLSEMISIELLLREIGTCSLTFYSEPYKESNNLDDCRQRLLWP